MAWVGRWRGWVWHPLARALACAGPGGLAKVKQKPLRVGPAGRESTDMRVAATKLGLEDPRRPNKDPLRVGRGPGGQYPSTLGVAENPPRVGRGPGGQKPAARWPWPCVPISVDRGCQGGAGQGRAGQGRPGHGTARHGTARRGTARHGAARRGAARNQIRCASAVAMAGQVRRPALGCMVAWWGSVRGWARPPLARGLACVGAWGGSRKSNKNRCASARTGENPPTRAWPRLGHGGRAMA